MRWPSDGNLSYIAKVDGWSLIDEIKQQILIFMYDWVTKTKTHTNCDQFQTVGGICFYQYDYHCVIELKYRLSDK